MGPWSKVWGGIKNKTCRYLLHRYMGQFFDDKINLDQLDVELFNGKATIKDIGLNCQFFNDYFEEQGIPLEITSGRIGLITLSVPLNAIMSDSSEIVLDDLCICVRPVTRQNDCSSTLESMWSSASSSIELAKDYMQKECTEEEKIESTAQAAGGSIDGVEVFAATIENFLNRIRAKGVNTTVRLEFIEPGSSQGIALVFKINHISYKNKAGDDKSDTQDNVSVDSDDMQRVSTYSTHSLMIEGVDIYTEEFKLSHPFPVPGQKTSTADDGTAKYSHDVDVQSSMNDTFYSMISSSDSETLKRTHASTSSMYGSHYSNVSSVSDRSATPTALSTDDDDEDDDEHSQAEQEHKEPVSFPSKSIQMARVDGSNVITLKLKQSENVTGPKVDLNLQLGAINVFTTPRQLHLVNTFFDAFAAKADPMPKETYLGGSLDLGQHSTSAMSVNRNMGSSMTGMLGAQGNWGEPLEECSFLTPAFSARRSSGIYSTDDGRSTVGSTYCESVNSSLSSSATTTCSSKFARKVASLKASGDISNINISIASVMMILLHEDVLLSCSSPEIQGSPLSEESEVKMLKISEDFFSQIDEKCGLRNYTCQKNHVRLTANPILLDGTQQRNENLIVMRFVIYMNRVDLDEVLEGVIMPLIDFERKETSMDQFQKRPEVVIHVNTTTPSAHYNRGRKVPTPPRTEFEFNLNRCTVDLDISIYDRLSALFASSPFQTVNESVDVDDDSKKAESRNVDRVKEFNVTSSIVHLKLRFPIADNRPIHDPNRVPWWKQNVRSDLLLFSFYQLRLKITSILFEILSNEINAYYDEGPAIPRIHVLKTSLINNSVPNLKAPNVDYPTISIEFPTEKTLQAIIKCCSEDSDSGETSGESCELYTTRNREYSPFSSKRVCRQSDIIHANAQTGGEEEKVILPGDIDEMRKFCETAMKTSKLQIRVALPNAQFQIKNKQLYELIYNRINTDLLMWEPSSPFLSRKTKPPPAPTIEQSLLNIGMTDSFYIPSTSPVHPYDTDDIKFEPCGSSSSSPVDTESCQSDASSQASVYMSTCERKKSKRSDLPAVNASSCSFELNVNRGALSLFPPVRDSEKRVLPNQLGEFSAFLDGFTLFFVNGFNGDENMAHLCVHAKDLKLYHCGLIPLRASDPKFPDLSGLKIPSHMKSTLYPTPRELIKGDGVGCSTREMLSVAMKIEKIPQSYIKRLKVTAGIQAATLRHHPALSQHTWLNQLLDFLDVVDYPIEGYRPFAITTEMQLHLWECAVDYRPNFFPFRTVLEMGSFMTSSTVISTNPGCNLRFVAEECVLSIAPYDKETSKPNHKITAYPSSELVPVIDLGLLDISLRLNDRTSESNPKLDMRVSVQDVHIRTCFDSGRALSNLVAYIAADADLLDPTEDNEMIDSFTSSAYCDTDLLSVLENKCAISNITPNQQERMCQLLAEAAADMVTARAPNQDKTTRRKFERKVELFYFPDESQQKERDKGTTTSSPSTSEEASRHASIARRGSDLSNEFKEILNFESSVMQNSYMLPELHDDDDGIDTLPQVREDLGDVKKVERCIHGKEIARGLEENFCIITEEEQSYLSQCGIKEVKVTEDPLRLIDNYFKPSEGKPDLLKAPDNFPTPDARHTLCEMTMTWHIYGGYDFPAQPEDESAKTKHKNKENIQPELEPSMSDCFKHGVSYTKGSETVTPGKKQKEKISWKSRGGYGRDHEIAVEMQLTKVRCSHEVYPRYTNQASRQVLVISELEIRDRVQTSDINKMLCAHLINELSKGSKPMVVIKALNVRPHPRTSMSEECSLRISLLPLRLHIDQDTLSFMSHFFEELTSACLIGANAAATNRVRRQSSPQPPVVMVDDDIPDEIQDLQAQELVKTNLDLLMEGDEKCQGEQCKENPEAPSVDIPESDQKKPPIYFREVIFSPEVTIRLDYHGRRIDMSKGPIPGLVMGLGHLQCSEIKLKKIVHRHGLLGVDKLLLFLFKEWLQDIKKNQVQGILSGVSPAYPIFQLVQGIYDLFKMPFEQYQKDGRFIRGLQLGAQSFTARTMLAALEITTRLIQLLQFTAETAYDMVSPGPSVRSIRRNRKGKRKRPHRPQDIREGVVNAYQIVKEGINSSANALIETAVVEHDQKGYTGAVGGIIRQIPQLVVQPAVLATQATNNILGGVKSSLVPEAKKEARDKWKGDSD